MRVVGGCHSETAGGIGRGENVEWGEGAAYSRHAWPWTYDHRPSHFFLLIIITSKYFFYPPADG